MTESEKCNHCDNRPCSCSQALETYIREGVARPAHRINPNGSSSCPVGYTPQQIWRAYGFNELFKKGITGEEQNIAIIVAFGSPTAKKDLEIFSKTFGLPRPKLKIYFPQGQPGFDTDWAIETSLDIQWAHALAPKATIHLVVAINDTIGSLLGAVDFASNLGVQVVSMSFVDGEVNVQPLLDFHFQNPGIVYTAASGDIGAIPQWPAISPSVISVGGTTLHLNKKGKRIAPETAWSGSGGGISRFFPEPQYQIDFGINTAPSNNRANPDVAFVADPDTGAAVFISTPVSTGETGWVVVGGTSLSCPCWAAIIALADQIRKIPLTDGHEALYNLAKGKFYECNYRDITKGSAGPCGPLCQAGPGYDFLTGLGTPRVESLVPNLRRQPKNKS